MTATERTSGPQVACVERMTLYMIAWFSMVAASHCINVAAHPLRAGVPHRIITGPPTHSVGARLVTVAGVCRRL